MTHANHPQLDLAHFQHHAKSLAAEPPSLASTSGLSKSELPRFFSILPVQLTSSSRPPAWWLDERAKLTAGSALVC